ncbi:MAG: hypothetical protein ACOC3Z_03025 [Nanoarchaeota archaeon]
MLFLNQFEFFLIQISLIIILILSILFYKIKQKQIGKSGMFYSLLSIVLISLTRPDFNFLIYFIFISEIFFLIFFSKILKKIQENNFFKPKKISKKSVFFSFFQHFIFIIVISVIVFIATVSIHESGHFFSSKMNNCEYQRIIFQKNLPDTQIICSENQNINIIILSGIFSPFVLSALLLISGGKIIREIALMMIGFNLLLSYKDYIDLNFSIPVSLFLAFSGVFVLTASLILFTKLRTSEIS